MRRLAASARRLTVALVVLTAFTSTAPPAGAELRPEAAPAAPASLSAAALRAAAAAPSTALAQTADTSSTASSDAGFLGTSKGKLIAVLFVAGAAWAIYSANHDREPVRSPVR